MFDVTTWLKTWTGALLACLLVLAIAAPSVRSDFCATDTSASGKHNAVAEAQGFDHEVAVDVGQVDDQDASDTKGGEPGGHCHHSPSMLSPLIGAKAMVFADRIRLVPQALRMPPSSLSDGPNEPPRA